MHFYTYCKVGQALNVRVSRPIVTNIDQESNTLKLVRSMLLCMSYIASRDGLTKTYSLTKLVGHTTNTYLLHVMFLRLDSNL